MHPAPPTEQPARSPEADLDQWRTFEADLSVDRYRGRTPDAVLTGDVLPVLISAPHAVRHLRHLPDGTAVDKAADLYTGGLARQVARRSRSGYLIAAGAQSHDGNFCPRGTFRDKLGAQLASGEVALVVDVHGMKDGYGPAGTTQICVGTGHDSDRLGGPVWAPTTELVDAAVTYLRGAGLDVSVNDPWSAEATHTVTNTARRVGVPALQLELARSVRDPFTAPAAAAATVEALTGLLCLLRPLLP